MKTVWKVQWNYDLQKFALSYLKQFENSRTNFQETSRITPLSGILISLISSLIQWFPYFWLFTVVTIRLFNKLIVIWVWNMWLLIENLAICGFAPISRYFRLNSDFAQKFTGFSQKSLALVYLSQFKDRMRAVGMVSRKKLSFSCNNLHAVEILLSFHFSNSIQGPGPITW